MKKTAEIIITILCMLIIWGLLHIATQAIDIADAEEKASLAGYTDEDVMCLANMVYGEISAICFDDSYTEQEQNLAMQEWACVALNHIKMGIADSIPELMKTKTEAGYFVWHSRYATEDYMAESIKADAGRYERCRVNVLIALAECMTEEVPDSVIYADLKAHGEVYKTYKIDTGYYRSTVYLCHDGRGNNNA